MNIPSEIKTILPWLKGTEAWLVGGSVRDAFLQRATHDYDLIVTGDVIALGRRIANALDGDFYVLDAERRICRVFLPVSGETVTLDLAALRVPSIDDDLLQRDFTINAMALALADGSLLDPTGGRQDLIDRRLQLCEPDALRRDPVRILRAIRFGVELDLCWAPELIHQLRNARPLLAMVSAERLRDEFFSILGLERAHAALRLLVYEGIDTILFPFLPPAEKRPEGSALKVVDWLCRLLSWLAPGRSGTASSLPEAEALLELGPWRVALDRDLRQRNASGRSLRELLLLAAYLAGKLEDGSKAAEGEHRNALSAARHLHLSNVESRALKTLLDVQPQLDTFDHCEDHAARAGYRYFCTAGALGSAGILLFLARTFAALETEQEPATGRRAIATAAFLFEAVFGYQETEKGPLLMDGRDVQKELGIRPGPDIGVLLAKLQEAQALGEIRTPEEARRYLRTLFNDRE